MAWVRRVLVELVGLVVLQPVRRGRVRAVGWPRGLAPVVLVALGGYVLAGALVVFAGPLRRLDLATSPDQATLPGVTLAPLLLLITLALSLALTSALHAHRWAKLALVVLVTTQVLAAGVMAFPTAGLPVLLLSLLAATGVVALTLARRGRAFAWFEFPVVTALVALGMVLPLVLQQGPQRQLGFDLRVLNVTQLFVFVGPLAIPAVIIGGAALVEIAVATAGWGLRLVRDEAPRPVWRGLAVALVVFGMAGVVWRLRADRLPLLYSAIPIILALLALLVLRAHRRPVDAEVDPDRLAEAWPGLLVPLAVGSTAFLVPSFVAVVVQAVATGAGRPTGGPTGALVDALTSSLTVALLRLVLVVVAVVLAVRWSRRGEHARPLLMLSFAVLLVPSVVGVLSGTRFTFARTADALAVDCIVLAVLLLAGFAVLRRLTSRRLTALMMVLALSGCYLFRGVVADPIGLVLGVSAIALTLFGLLWRLLTDAGWTRTSTPGFPLPTRVLFFWANALLAVTSLAFVALSRATGGSTDVTPFSEFGDFVLGTPLYLAAVLGCLWQTLHPGRPPVLPEPGDGGFPDRSGYGRADSAHPTPPAVSAAREAATPSGWTAAVSPASTVVAKPASAASSAVARTQ